MKELFATHGSIEASPATLVQRCLQGDANAWRQLVDRYRALSTRCLHAMGLALPR